MALPITRYEALRHGGIATRWRCDQGALPLPRYEASRPCGVADHCPLSALPITRHHRCTMLAPFEDGAAGIAGYRHCGVSALRPDGIATCRHCDLAALRPRDSRLGLRTGPVAVRSCRRQCLGLAGCRHCVVAATRAVFI